MPCCSFPPCLHTRCLHRPEHSFLFCSPGKPSRPHPVISSSTKPPAPTPHDSHSLINTHTHNNYIHVDMCTHTHILGSRLQTIETNSSQFQQKRTLVKGYWVTSRRPRIGKPGSRLCGHQQCPAVPSAPGVGRHGHRGDGITNRASTGPWTMSRHCCCLHQQGCFRLCLRNLPSLWHH